MSRKSKVLDNLSSIITDKYIINENEIENVNVCCEFIYEIEANAIYVVDKRDEEHIMHSLESIILTLIFAMMANCNRFTEVYLFMCKHFNWLDRHIHFDNVMPSISTLRRVISYIKPADLEQLCVKVMNNFLKNNAPLYQNGDLIIEDIKPMDGKTANSSDRKSSKNGKVSKMNAMSIVSVKNGNCEATEFIGDKTNEIPTGPELLKRVNVKNTLVTFDALSTQKDTIDYIAGNEGYYIAPVKGNQEALENSLVEYFSDNKLYNEAKKESYKLVVEKAHGTVEKREYIFTNDIDWLPNKEKWLKLKSIGIAKRTYLENNETKTDTRYFITNIDSKEIEILSSGIRNEWCVENQLHFYLDTVFQEDKNTCFVENTQKNLNIIRKFCLSMLKIFKKNTKISMNDIRFSIAMDYEYEIEKILKSLYQ